MKLKGFDLGWTGKLARERKRAYGILLAGFASSLLLAAVFSTLPEPHGSYALLAAAIPPLAAGVASMLKLARVAVEEEAAMRRALGGSLHEERALAAAAAGMLRGSIDLAGTLWISVPAEMVVFVELENGVRVAYVPIRALAPLVEALAAPAPKRVELPVKVDAEEESIAVALGV